MRRRSPKRSASRAAAAATSPTATPARPTSCRTTRTSAARRSRATRRSDFIALVQRHRIAWHEKHKGQLFCDESSEQIIRMLLDECAQGSVDRWQPCAVRALRHAGARLRARQRPRRRCSAPRRHRHRRPVDPEDRRQRFRLPHRPPVRPSHRADAPGPRAVDLRRRRRGSRSPRWPGCRSKRGSSRARRDARRIRRGPALHPPRAERPGDPADLEPLASRASRSASTWRPAAIWKQRCCAPRTSSRRQLANELERFRAAPGWRETWLERSRRRWPTRPMPELARSRPAAGSRRRCTAGRCVPNGTEGYRKAEVTAGGVDTRELSSQTHGKPASQPGLYFIGEVVDVTGWLGGYNFQWAWASAAACARAMAATLSSSACRYNRRLCEPGANARTRITDFPPGNPPDSDSIMTTIRVKENEPFDVALRRFKRTIEKARPADRTAGPRVLRKAHRRAQAQEGRRRQAPLQAHPQHAVAQELF